jgi:restriction endonuclease S subunit
MKLGDVITLRKGNTIEIQDAETYRISGIQNYGKGVVIRRQVKGSELTMREYQVIEANQLMWCKVDTKNGAFGVTHPEHVGTLASPNMALADIDPKKADAVFLETLFRIPSFADYITNLSTGTTNRKYLTPKELLRQVTLPDWSTEQQRQFVDKLKRIEACGLPAELAHQEDLVTKLKQAILQEAITGRLTAGWRAAQTDVEPASQLLARIRAEKARLVAAKKLRPEKPLPPIPESEIPFALPDGWEWCRLGALGYTQTGTTPDTTEPANFGSHISFVKPADIDGTGITYDQECLSERGLNEGRLIEAGSILMVCIGSSTGKVASTDRPVSCNQQINTLTPLADTPVRCVEYILK